MRNVGVTGLLLFLCTPVLAQQIGAVDPSIGSYFYFAALDRRCASPDASRAEALEKFKSHFLRSVKEIYRWRELKMPPEAQARITEIERDGPSQKDLDQFSNHFAAFKPGEVALACSSAVKDIADRIWIEEQMAESARNFRAGVKSGVTAAP